MAELKGGTLLQSRLASLAKKISREGAVRVGFIDGARYPDGQLVALVAAAQNFGTETIPARPFFSNVVRAASPEWGAKLGRILERNGFDVEKALGLIGEVMAGDIRESIIETNTPPLAPATIARKGFAKPLIETDLMIDSISAEVEMVS